MADCMFVVPRPNPGIFYDNSFAFSKMNVSDEFDKIPILIYNSQYFYVKLKIR